MSNIGMRLFLIHTGQYPETRDFRLAPEYPYPNGLNDGYVALKWVCRNTSGRI